MQKFGRTCAIGIGFELSMENYSMKKFKNILVKSALALVTALLATSYTHAQNVDKSTIQNFIQGKTLVFKAQTVMPMTGSVRTLTSDYEVKLSGDSLTCYLPYFGRAYTAGYGEGGPINFTTTKFEYKATQRKKGGWNITIQPKNVNDVRVLNFTVFEKGYANLQVLSNNRQPISFTGFVQKK